MELTRKYKKSKTKIYLTIIILNFIIITMLYLLNSTADRFVNHNKHIVYSISNIKYIVTQSHLWLEEYLVGDKKELAKINLSLQEAKEQLDILINGGKIRKLYFKSTTNDSFINEHLLKIKSELLIFESFVEKRIRLKQSSGSISDISFDNHFDELISELEVLDKYISEKFQKRYSQYTNIKIIIYIAIFILICLALYLITRFNKEIEHNINIINKQSKQLLDNNMKLEEKVKVQTELNLKNKEKIFHQQKLLSMNELIRNIAHHWRQPLSYISSIASSVEWGLIKETQLNESMRNIVNTTTQLSNVIDYFANDIKNEITVNEFTIDEFITKVETLIMKCFENENIELVINKLDSNINITTYENRLVTIVLSLLSNSRDVLLQRKIENKKVYLETRVVDDKLEISINDNAGGIKKEILNRVFEPYFTTQHKSANKGLSLYLNYDEIINTLHGEFSVQNNKNGALFIIKLPLKCNI